MGWMHGWRIRKMNELNCMILQPEMPSGPFRPEMLTRPQGKCHIFAQMPL